MLEDLCHVDQIDDLLAESRSRHLLQFQRVAHRRHIGDELAGSLHVELLLGGARTRATGQPRQFLARQIAALRLAHISLAVTFHALQHIRGVAALEGVDHAVVNLPHRLAHLVEEPPVVGDEQQRALPGGPTVLQMLGKPVDRHHVQVVRRLVKREDVPILEQQTGQIGTATLTAGQRSDLRVQADAAEQRLDDLTRPRLRGPFVILAALQRGLAHRGVVIERIALVKHAERQAVALGYAPGIRLLRAAEQMQQRGFAVAVLADDADAVAFEDTLRHIGEDGLGGKGKGNVFESKVIGRHDSPM